SSTCGPNSSTPSAPSTEVSYPPSSITSSARCCTPSSSAATGPPPPSSSSTSAPRCALAPCGHGPPSCRSRAAPRSSRSRSTTTAGPAPSRKAPCSSSSPVGPNPSTATSSVVGAGKEPVDHRRDRGDAEVVLALEQEPEQNRTDQLSNGDIRIEVRWQLPALDARGDDVAQHLRAVRPNRRAQVSQLCVVASLLADRDHHAPESRGRQRSLERFHLGDQVLTQVARRGGVQQPHLLADQVTQQVESLGPVPIQRRARIPTALSHPSQGDPLPPLLQHHLTGRREH